MKNLNEQGLDKFLTSEGVKVLDVYATWCNPCKTIVPILEELAEEYDGGVEFAKINFDESEIMQDMLSHFQVMGIPAVLIMGNGKGGFIVGTKPKEFYREAIDKILEENN